MALRLALCWAAIISTWSAPSAQPSNVFSTLAGRGVDAAPAALSVDAYPFMLASSGVGGTVGFERGRWHVGVAAFTVAPPDFIEETFLRDTEGVTLSGNAAAEGFARYYPRADRRWLYAEVLGGPEWFEVTEDASGVTETFVSAYVAPKLGVRVLPLGDYVSVDAAIGYAFNLGGTETRSVGSASYRASSGGVLPFLQVGTRIPLGP